MQAGSAPAGYLICNGASVLRADYPALSAYWAASTPSYPYGAVDGTHMSLPNFPQGTFPTGGTPGITGGEATHVLTTTEMPSHQHTQVLGGSITTSAGTAGSYVIGNANSGLVSATGGGGAHNNIPPFVGVSFLVKT
jgi:microcystin-dependent protein